MLSWLNISRHTPKIALLVQALEAQLATHKVAMQVLDNPGLIGEARGEELLNKYIANLDQLQSTTKAINLKILSVLGVQKVKISRSFERQLGVIEIPLEILLPKDKFPLVWRLLQGENSKQIISQQGDGIMKRDLRQEKFEARYIIEQYVKSL